MATGTEPVEDPSTRFQMEQKIADRERHDIIIVASLIDKAPNLAGLARTAEIFNAQTLVVGDIKITEDPLFQRVSVTSYKWMPIEEVKPHAIAEYLELKKSHGYTIIALEQTANSTSLPRYTFPSKVVLLLGAEREGVPVTLLNRVDDCIEIPQFGMIRSLNVHVSASILIWEYTRQRHCIEGKS